MTFGDLAALLTKRLLATTRKSCDMILSGQLISGLAQVAVSWARLFRRRREWDRVARVLGLSERKAAIGEH
jgi:hypothetical protein